MQDEETPDVLGEALRRAGHRRQFAAGQALFVEGDSAERVFVIEAGWVLLSCAAPDGKEVVLGLRGPGDVIGDMSILDGEPRSATALALDPLERGGRTGVGAHRRAHGRRGRAGDDQGARRAAPRRRPQAGRVLGARHARPCRVATARAERAVRQRHRRRGPGRAAAFPGAARELVRRLARGDGQGVGVAAVARDDHDRPAPGRDPAAPRRSRATPAGSPGCE